MPSPVSTAATAFDLSAVRTAQPVVSGGFARWADEISFLVGHNLHNAGCAFIEPRITGRTSLVGLTYSVWVPYSRSSGAQVVRVGVELHPGEDDEAQTITVTLPTGAAWIDAGGLDGSVSFYNPPPGRTRGEEHVGWVDVSGVTIGALTPTAFKAETVPAGSKGAGIRAVRVHEAPLAQLAVSSSEPGWDAAATRPGRLVIDGSASSPRGVQRLFHCLDNARANWRKHLLIADIESADANAYGVTPHWSRETNTYGAIDWGFGNNPVTAATPTDPVWFLNARDLYPGTATTWKLIARYRTSNGSTCGLRLWSEGGEIVSGAWVAAAAATSQDLTLTGTSGAWAWASTDVTLPADGTDGLVKIWFEAKGPGAGQLLSLATIGAVENES